MLLDGEARFAAIPAHPEDMLTGIAGYENKYIG